MRLVRLFPDFELKEFDCGDNNLNEFIFDNAKPAIEKRIANTFILDDEGTIAAYFCLLNDKISRLEISDSRWKTIKERFPESKQFRSYPSIKIGRFAVSSQYRGMRLGSQLITTIKVLLCRMINVVAFQKVLLHFHQKSKKALVDSLDFYGPFLAYLQLVRNLIKNSAFDLIYYSIRI